MAAKKSEWRTYLATAYTARCTGCTGVTKSGIDVRHTQFDENGRRIVAVDPRVIPLGTALEIRLADGTVIEAVAEDIGGSIKGARIDVLHATKKQADKFGKQDVEVRVSGS
ncbi:hypothetical protein BBD42_15500 [Paenibacillus sp. BIHB 4019]|uniref:3D domain-containing protein n=1 Tax=Paenibacillus sp. BIHB 4019 TaxID=1870819 RepID=A0A1B2DJ41_9BACL|nr:3D domain-containing protein [Paenibacillus sp. BIHB 4019]ANY67713.1 hypothetical protein BBD42_15500 [Paenibacillus sp. BIHB 4019]